MVLSSHSAGKCAQVFAPAGAGPLFNILNLKGHLFGIRPANEKGERTNIAACDRALRVFNNSEHCRFQSWGQMKKYIVACFALVVMFTGVSSVLASPLGQHLDHKISTDVGSVLALAFSLKNTPEPGSLFVLGTVLLSLAGFVFWKAAKSSKNF